MRVQTRDLAAREEKLVALQKKLTDSVGALVTGDDWKRALEFAAKFRSRSFNNTMLIYVQHYAAFQQGRSLARVIALLLSRSAADCGLK